VKVAPPIPKEQLRAIADVAAAVVPITKVPAVNQNKYLEAYLARVQLTIADKPKPRRGRPRRATEIERGASSAVLAVEGALPRAV
jgi:hypothetical protein